MDLDSGLIMGSAISSIVDLFMDYFEVKYIMFKRNSYLKLINELMKDD